MDKEISTLRSFCERFFLKLGAKVRSEEKVIIIEDVPEKFESFFGKKSPFYLTFSKEASESIKDSELIVNGSYLLRAMSDFLEDKGQTTLLKLIFNVETNDIRDYLKLVNCKIEKVSKKEVNEFIAGFTFLNVFQYLNEKEQVINSLHLDKEGLIDFDINNYSSTEGKKSEVFIGDIKSRYEKAKGEIREIIKPKIEEVSNSLKKRLQKEIERISKHYDLQIKEIDEKTISYEKQIQELEAGNTNGDIKNIPSRINKLKEQIEELRKGEQRGLLVKEREFFINDEKHKYSLSLDNKLINTTIIYYPVYKFSVFFKSNEGGREIDIDYNPVKKSITKIYCDLCKKEINEIILCSSGHISCKECISKCSDCNKDYCVECLTKSCDFCGKKLCKRCIKKCVKCGKQFCSNHIRKSGLGDVCINCMIACPSCGQAVSKLNKCPSCFRQMCDNCARMELINSNGKTACTSCTQRCLSCGKYYEKDQFKRCSFCNLRQCNYPGKCLSCRRQLCAKLKGR